MQKCKGFISIIAIQPIKICTLITYGVRAMREYTNTIECRVRHNYKKKGATCDLKYVSSSESNVRKSVPNRNGAGNKC